MFGIQQEELGLRRLAPNAYTQLAEQIELVSPQRQAILAQAAHTLKRALVLANIKAKVESRVKTIHSIYGKMVHTCRPLTEIYDLMGVRIITRDTNQCFRALEVVHSLWIPLCEEFDDYISDPKPNGYQSLHTTVVCSWGLPVEIQIRSQRMHREAERGSAAHWRYKARGGMVCVAV